MGSVGLWGRVGLVDSRAHWVVGVVKLCHRSLTCCLPNRVVMVECGAQDGPQGLGHRDLGYPAGRPDSPLFLQSVQVITFLFSKKRQKGDGV